MHYYLQHVFLSNAFNVLIVASCASLLTDQFYISYEGECIALERQQKYIRSMLQFNPFWYENMISLLYNSTVFRDNLYLYILEIVCWLNDCS